MFARTSVAKLQGSTDIDHDHYGLDMSGHTVSVVLIEQSKLLSLDISQYHLKSQFKIMCQPKSI